MKISFAKISFALMSVLASFCATQSSSADDAQPIRVIAVQGTAHALHNNSSGKTSEELRNGSLLQENELISVDAGSALVISLGHDVVTKLAAGSLASVQRVNGKDWLLDLKHGITAAAVRNPEKRRDHYRVKTSTAVMGVRGTVFYIEALENRPVFVCTCVGKVQINSVHGDRIDEVTATHHDRPLTIEGSASSRFVSKTAPMGTGHSDQDVVDLQKLLAAL